jgi:hypothetical protein
MTPFHDGGEQRAWGPGRASVTDRASRPFLLHAAGFARGARPPGAESRGDGVDPMLLVAEPVSSATRQAQRILAARRKKLDELGDLVVGHVERADTAIAHGPG